MSILIKALKQAERDHMARSAASAPSGTAVLEAEPPPPKAPAPAAPAARSGEALSLAPVESNEPGGSGDYPLPALPPASNEEPAAPNGAASDAQSDADSAAESAAETAAETAHGGATDHGLMVAYETPAETSPPAPAQPPAPAPTSKFSRPLAAVLQTTDQSIAAPRAPAAAPPPGPAAAPPAAPRGAGEPAARNAPAAKALASPMAEAPAQPAAAAAPQDDPKSEMRKAARQLMASTPAAAARKRRMAIVLGMLVLIAGAAAAAYWQGLFAGLDGVLQSVQGPGPAQTPVRALADRFPPAPSVPTDKSTKAHTHAAGAATATSAKTQAAGAAGEPAAADKPPAGARAAGNAAAVDVNRAGDGIHLRPPEATPERIRALLQDAYAAAGRGETAVAGRIYQQVVDLDRNSGDAWIGIAALAANSGDSAGANHAYRRALEIDPSDSIALGGLLGLQSNMDPQETESRLRLLIVHDGAQPVLLAALGKLLARQGRWLEAQETFFKAWTVDPSQPDVAFNLAVTLERIRQPLPALSFYRRALELAQDHSARFDIAVAQARVTALTPKQP